MWGSKRKRIREGARLPYANREGIDRQKLKDYVLEPDASSKAQGFAKRLGITRDDWRFLHDQILERLPDSEAIDWHAPTLDRMEFTVLVPIDGRNGERRLVSTAWSVDSRHEPWFVTAWVTSKPA